MIIFSEAFGICHSTFSELIITPPALLSVVVTFSLPKLPSRMYQGPNLISEECAGAAEHNVIVDIVGLFFLSRIR